MARAEATEVVDVVPVEAVEVETVEVEVEAVEAEVEAVEAEATEVVERHEVFEATRPDGTVVIIDRNIETGEQTLTE